MIEQGLDKNGTHLQIGDRVKVKEQYDTYLAIVKQLLNTRVNAKQIGSVKPIHYVSSSTIVKVTSLDD